MIVGVVVAGLMAAGLGVACRPSPAPRAVAAAPRLYASSLPGRAALVAPALDCTAPMLLPGRRPARRIEATPLHVPASAVGPRISSRPRLALPRAPEEVQALVDVPTLRACYRWARFATPSLQGTAEVVLAIDDYGVVEATFASPAGAGEAAAWADLGACVTSAFRARSLRPLLSAPATTTVPLVFVPSEQAPPRRRPARPALTAVTARRGCVARAPVVELGRAPAVTVDAFDQTLADARTEVVGRTAPVPPVQVGEPVVVRTVPASVVRETIGYQRGAYGACFAAARGAGLPDGAEVTLRATVDPDGRLRSPAARLVTPAQHVAGPALEACLIEALQALWMPPSDDGFSVVASLVQAPPLEPPPALPAWVPLEQLVAAAGRAQALAAHAQASAYYGALLAQAPADPRGRQWRLARLTSLREEEPWIGETELGEIAALVEEPHQPALAPDTAAQLCTIATAPHALAIALHHPGLLALAVNRYELLAPLAAELESLSYFRAEALWALGRVDDARRRFAITVRSTR